MGTRCPRGQRPRDPHGGQGDTRSPGPGTQLLQGLLCAGAACSKTAGLPNSPVSLTEEFTRGKGDLCCWLPLSRCATDAAIPRVIILKDKACCRN